MRSDTLSERGLAGAGGATLGEGGALGRVGSRFEGERNAATTAATSSSTSAGSMLPRGPTRSAAPASTSSAGVGRGGEGGGRAAAGEVGAADVPEGSGSATWRHGGQACEGWAHAVRVL